TALTFLIASIYFSAYPSLGQVSYNYTYYGVVPAKIWRYFLADWNATPGWMDRSAEWILGFDTAGYGVGAVGLNGRLIALKALLTIVATADNTNVAVYDLTTGNLIDAASLGAGERRYVLLNNGTRFKVLSDKHVSVLLLNYQKIPEKPVEGPLPHGFYTATNGLFVGKEFIFMASQGTTGTYYTILAVEPSEVKITRDDGYETTYKLDANSYQYIQAKPFSIYKITSTGNIMVQAGTISGIGSLDTTCFLIPSVEGGFVGKFFLTRAFKAIEWGWDPERDYAFRALATEETKIKVYDLATKQVIEEHSVKAGSGVGFRPNAYAIAVVSEKPITLLHIHNGSIKNSAAGGGGGVYQGYANGVMHMSIRPGEDTMIQLPTDAYVEAYFFAKETAQLTIDDIPVTVQSDSPYLFTQPGLHKVRSNKEIILQINLWPREPEIQGLWFKGTPIPCIETASIKPDVTIHSLEETGFPMTQIIIGVAIVAVIGAVVIILRRRSATKVAASP
ncbi:MAG: hypothetical protein QW782_09925, partial [Candidatus Bathyarchaeia archaeon]